MHLVRPGSAPPGLTMEPVVLDALDPGMTPLTGAAMVLVAHMLVRSARERLETTRRQMLADALMGRVRDGGGGGHGELLDEDVRTEKWEGQ